MLKSTVIAFPSECPDYFSGPSRLLFVETVREMKAAGVDYDQTFEGVVGVFVTLITALARSQDRACVGEEIDPVEYEKRLELLDKIADMLKLDQDALIRCKNLYHAESHRRPS